MEDILLARLWYRRLKEFGDTKLNYDNCPQQERSVHFAKEEKRLRYEKLKKELGELVEDRG